MKKYLFLMLITITLLTGCGKSNTTEESTDSNFTKPTGTTSTTTTTAASETMDYSKVAGEYLVYNAPEPTNGDWWLLTEDGTWERQGSFCAGYERHSGKYTFEEKEDYYIIKIDYEGNYVSLKLKDSILVPMEHNLPDDAPFILYGTDCYNLEWDKWSSDTDGEREYIDTDVFDDDWE